MPDVPGLRRLEFSCPATAQVGGVPLAPLLAAASQRDAAAFAALRPLFRNSDDFDRFAEGLRHLLAGECDIAATAFGHVSAPEWQVAAPLFRALALLGSGEPFAALALANRVRDRLEPARLRQEPSFGADRALVVAVLSEIVAAEAAHPVDGPVRVASPFRYLVSYPRSGSTMLRQFLSFAFDAPRYSVYPGDGRYFSRPFREPNPGHAVFVKDHRWQDAYALERSIVLFRDGRNALVSYARFLYVRGVTQRVGRGALADFIDYTASRDPYRFWGDHIRAVLTARDRGADVRAVRYEDVLGNFARLLDLARELAEDAPALCEDRDRYETLATLHRSAANKNWRQSVELPPNSFIPQNWSAGGETIRWRDCFDATAARRFHELGGTEMLVRLGYENDEAWWRQL